MTPDQIKSRSVAELAAIYPTATVAELRKMRKRAICAIWQRSYRREGRVTANDFLGSLDGPAIARCKTQEGLIENAIAGSERLLRAIERTGVRP